MSKKFYIPQTPTVFSTEIFRYVNRLGDYLNPDHASTAHLLRMGLIKENVDQ